MKRLSKLSLLFVLFLCLFPLKGLSETLPFRTSLDNGLKVVIEEDRSAPVVAVQLWVRVGSADERGDEAGVSHVIEHMLFKGTEKRGVGEIAREIEGVGGVINAFTSYDQTVYHITIPSRFFRKALDVLSDMAMDSVFDPQELEREIRVVIEELKRGEDSPSNRIYKKVMALSYTTHPYGRPVIGYERTLLGLTRERVLDFYRKWYVPNNMTLVVVGDVEKEEALKAIEGFFGGFKKGSLPERSRPEEPPQREARVGIIHQDVKEAKLRMAFHIPGITSPDVYALDILSSILGQGRSSRLFRRIKEEKGLVRSIDTYSMTPMDPGLFFISADLEPGKVEDAFRAILEVIKEVREGKIGEDELARAKINVEADFLYERETFQGRARKWGYFEVVAGGVEFERRYLEGIRKVTTEDITRVARRYFNGDNLNVALLLPKGVTGPRASQLKAIAMTLLRKAGIRRVVLKNGITLIVKENHSNPTVSVYTAFLGGLLVEDEERNGISRIFARMLTRGTESMDAGEIARRIESMGGRVAGFSGRNTFGLEASFLSRFFEEGMRIYSDLILHPTFPEKELEKVKRDLLQEIDAEKDNLFITTIRLLDRDLYRGHPYSMNPLGSKEGVRRVRRSDLLDYYNTYVRGRNMVMAVVGDVVTEEVIGMVEGLFGSMPEGERPSFKEARVLPPKGVEKVEGYRKREQAHIAMGFVAPSLKDPDRYAMEVLEEILSGMSGRLFVELRDKKGLAYVVTAIYRPGYNTGSFVTYMATSPGNLGVSIEGMRKELLKIIYGEIAPVEVEDAKAAIIGRYQIGLQSNGAQASDMALNEILGLGYDFFREYPKRIEAVTMDDVIGVAERYIDLNGYVLAILRPPS